MSLAKSFLRFLNGPELHEIRKGIYAMDGRAVQDGQPLVAVHPYFQLYDKYIVSGSMAAYVKRFEDLLVSHQGPVIVLEEKRRIGPTKRRLASLGRMDAYFVRTGRKTPSSKEIGWAELAEFLKPFQQPVLLAGGYLRLGEDFNDYAGHFPFSSFGGCLGTAYTELGRERLRVEILPDLTFS